MDRTGYGPTSPAIVSLWLKPDALGSEESFAQGSWRSIACRFRRFDGQSKQPRALDQPFETRQSPVDVSEPSAQPQCGRHNQPAQGSEQADANRNDGDQFRTHAFSLAASDSVETLV